MWKGRKIIAVTPAGRRRYLDLLKPQLDAYLGVLDEWHIWKNTTDPDDARYIDELASDFVRVIECPVRVNGNHSINAFFAFCDDPNAVYVRFDDDVIELDSLDAFRRFLEFRIENPDPPVVYANILNNAISTWIHQRLGNLPGNTGYDCLDPIAWGDPHFVKTVHDEILENSLQKFRFDGAWTFHECQRVSINCISWLGGRLRMPLDCDEEIYLSTTWPRTTGVPNCMFGGYCVVHFAFFTQRDELERAGYLDAYSLKLKTARSTACTMRVIQLDTRPRRSRVPNRVWTPGNTNAVMREEFDASNASPPKRPLWEVSAAYNAYQCKKIGWGYDSIRAQDPIERHASWIKIRYALDEWDTFDGPVMIMDSDAWIRDAEGTKKLVTENLAGNIAFLAAGEPACEATVVRGADMINGGILCFFPRPEVREFLQHAWDAPGEYASEWPWEQVALNQTYKSNVAGCQSWTKILPPETFNTPAGSHIVHCWWKDIAYDLLVEDFLTTICDDHLDRQKQTKELVVARYNENVDWVAEYLAYVDRVTIYDKSETPETSVTFDHPKIRVVPMKNVGREAHTYAHHFAQNDLCDVIVCTQGRFQDHVPPEDFERLVRDDDTTTYGRKHDALDVAWDSTPMAHFGWTEHHNHAGTSRMCPVGMTMGEYYTTYISPEKPASFPWVEGAIFKTNASKVRRFPVAVYEKIRGTLETSSNPEAAHVMERFWGSMLM